MSSIVNLLFVALWIVAGFLALRWAAVRYFKEPRRADVAAGAVVMAFAIGAAWPYSVRIGDGSPSPAATTAGTTAVVPSAAPDPSHDVRAACASAAAAARPVSGRIDVSGHLTNGQVRAEAGTVALGPGDTFALAGWGTNAGRDRPAQAACLSVDGRIFPSAGARYGTPRPDVAAAFKRPALGAAGFSITVPASSLPPGDHRLGVAIVVDRHTVGMLPQVVAVSVR